MTFWTFLCIGIGAYLIGSLSPAVILSVGVMKQDVRDFGSGNAGTTNMLRTFGWKIAAITFVLDVAKGAVVMLLALAIGGKVGMLVGGIAVIAGHNWPLYYGFRGGKGIATTLGVMLVAMPVESLVVLAVALLVMAISRMVSLGSLVGLILEIGAAIIFHTDDILLIVTVVALAVLAFLGHRSNIRRIVNGKERKIVLPIK